MSRSDKPVRAADRRPPSSNRAFTIIELVVAIVVSAIVITTVATALSRISRTRDVARTRLEAATRANSAIDAIRRDLASLVRDGDLFFSRVRISDATDFTRYGALDRDEILVFNNRLRPMQRDAYAGEGGEYESQYRIEDDAEGSVLWLRRDAVPDENPDGGGMAIPSIEGIVGLRIEAYDGEAWYSDWDSDLYGLPWALRVTVTATGESSDNISTDPMRSTVSLRTQIPIDRIVPPPPPPEEEEASDPSANGGEDKGADTGDPSMNGGVPTGPGGDGVDGMQGGPGRPGGNGGQPGRRPTFGGGSGGPTIIRPSTGSYGGRPITGPSGWRGNYSMSNRGP